MTTSLHRSRLVFSLYAALFLASPLAAVQGQDKPNAPAQVRIEVPDGPVEFGREFQLRVIRSFARQWRADPWQDNALAPLEVQLTKHELYEQDGQVTELFEFSCYCFLRGLVTLAAPELRLRPRAGGPGFVVQGEDVEIHVSSALANTPSAKLEDLHGLFPAPFSWRTWVLLALLLLPCIAALAWYLLHSRRNRSARDARMMLPPHQQALQLIEALRKSRLRGLAELRAEAVACSEIIRCYVASRFGWTSRDRTTEEVLADPRFANLEPAQARQDLRKFLEHWDAVKFAAHEPDVEEREGMLQRITEFIRVTSPTQETT